MMNRRRSTVSDKHLDDVGRVAGVALGGCSDGHQAVIDLHYVERCVWLIHVQLQTPKQITIM